MLAMAMAMKSTQHQSTTPQHDQNGFIGNSKNSPPPDPSPPEMPNPGRGLNGLKFPPELVGDVDLEGGTLLSVEESEEIDPEDGCKVQVATYHILSADQTEESTITKRRKLKVNCTQSLRRVEYTKNGEEKKYEERTVLDNCEGPRRDSSSYEQRFENGHMDNQFEDPSEDITEVLLRTQDSFLMLLREKKDALVKMFPELFSNLRTMPAIFELMPSTVMETIVNDDGSTTTRTKCSKAFSSRYTRHETYVNGVRKECKSRFRAFMEYAGPEGGFCIRLNDNADKDLSEDEGIELEDDTRSRISRSGLSEIPDSQSALVVTGRQGLPLVVVDQKAAKRQEKAWHAVTEMVESEARYVQKLALLDKFREESERARLLDKRQLSQLFANIASLHQFHEQHLLPQLMDRHREWQSTKKISDVLRKQAPFLKMYSEYTNNYKAATQMFEECVRRKRQFEDLVKRMEHLPECEHLSLVSHLICPVQRVMRYQLMLKEYQRHLTPQDPDWEDTETALALVLEAASHANEMMRKLDRYRCVLEVQEQLGNSIGLVSPARELLTKSRLWKCGSSAEERWLFVFNDLFLLASERNAAIGLIGGGSGGKFKLRAIFAPKYTQICEGDNLEREYSFYLRGADSPQGPQRCVELCCASQADKDVLFDTIWAVIQEAQCQKPNPAPATLTRNSANNHSGNNNNSKSCARCDTDFGWYTRQFSCRRCQQRFCKRCFGVQQQPKGRKMCMDCLRTAEGIRCYSEGVPLVAHGLTPQTRRNLLQIPASSSSSATNAAQNQEEANDNENSTIKASHITFRGPSGKVMQRYFVLRKDFCLYSYRTEKDKCALAMLPLSGCDIGIHQPEKFGLSIRHAHRIYWITCANESDHAEWMAALLLSANAKLPNEGSGTDQSEEEDHDQQQEQSDRRANTIGPSSGRKVSEQRPRPQPKFSFSASNPFSGLIRRSASMGDARIRQMNARNLQPQEEEDIVER